MKNHNWEYKKVSKLCGEAAFNYIIRAIDDALKNNISAVVTGPINKESINLAGKKYSGHTEILLNIQKQKIML